ncbi:right-handed parallel beta-helix repeat-containing protein [Arenicella xantha]|uniref:Parallel beta helix pectate lyase-like protein n=1 Tax=Arenicella xantha TaxID=644221 RepID=A0A395JLS9_9GAMM|nr:right-handed parallel beta-helix repeat-containing protein [Arenicella xantha]RBP48740.1 parallel beta helix pectate lyase-like protein [Arenicella xantha]
MDTDNQCFSVARKWTVLQGLFLAGLFIASVLATSLSARAATIYVVALPGAPGCDLVDAVNSANSDSAVGGCVAGTDGLDTIIFSPFFSRYELTNMVFSHPIRGSSATPEIASEIRIIGLGEEPLEIVRSQSADWIRLFTVGFSGDLRLENLSLQNWRQSDGYDGGTIRVAGKLSMDNVEVTDSVATYGGGISVQTGEALIRNSLIRDSAAGDSGGGIAVASPARLTIFDSTISHNTAQFGGGVAMIQAPGTALSLFNTTLTENSARYGGGLELYTPFVEGASEGSSVIIRNSIISGNTADNQAEVRFIDPDDAELMDVSNNLLGASAHSYAEAVNSALFLVNDNQALTSDYGNTDLRSIIGPLQNNGGKTMTHALVANSPAIDAGLPFRVSIGFPFAIIYYHAGCRGTDSALALSLGDYRPDQRGVERPLGTECDIGAYEYMPPDDACYVVKASNNNVLTFCL